MELIAIEDDGVGIVDYMGGGVRGRPVLTSLITPST